jgi:hypothetical protein
MYLNPFDVKANWHPEHGLESAAMPLAESLAM